MSAPTFQEEITIIIAVTIIAAIVIATIVRPAARGREGTPWPHRGQQTHQAMLTLLHPGGVRNRNVS